MTRTVLITGASSGIGYATALEFARNTLSVAGTARQTERLDPLAQTVAALPTPHGDFLPLAADVTSAEAMHAAVQRTVERFGRLDILVANAGLGMRGALVDSDWAEIDTLLRTNLDGVLHSIRAAVPAMRQAGGGHILLVSSVTYRLAMPYSTLYAATKAFVSSLADSLRLELEPDGIAVSDLIVGRTETAFNANRLGKGGRAEGASHLPTMTPEFVARAIYRTTLTRRRRVVLRWFDRLLLFANLILPDVIGRLALKQYK